MFQKYLIMETPGQDAKETEGEIGIVVGHGQNDEGENTYIVYFQSVAHRFPLGLAVHPSRVKKARVFIKNRIKLLMARRQIIKVQKFKKSVVG